MSRFILPFQRTYDKNGHPLDGAKLLFFETGTSTPKDTYSDMDLTTPNANPVIADSQGQFSDIYLNGNYRVRLDNKNDVTQPGYPADDVNSGSGDVVLNIAALKTFEGSSNQKISILGYYAAGDGGGGQFYWDDISTDADNGGTIIQATSVVTGRWKRLFSGEVNVRWFGAKGDGVTDDTTFFDNACAAFKVVYIPPGTYIVKNVSILTGNELYGAGWTSILKQKSDVAGGDYALAVNNADGGTTSVSGNAIDIKIRDMKIIGPDAIPVFSEHCHLVFLSAVSDVLIENVFFEAWKGDAIYIGSGDSGTVERHNERITIRKSKFDGVNKENRQAISVLDIDKLTVEDSYFTRTTKSTMPGAIDIEPNSNAYHVVKDITIRNNEFYDIGGSVGVISVLLPEVAYTVQPKGFVIENNYIDTITTYGLYFKYFITGGVTESTENFGIRWKNNHVDGNSVTSRAFGLINVKDAVINGNTFTDCANSALVGFSSADENVIDITFKDNLFQRLGEVGGNGLAIFTVNRLKIVDNEFNDCGTGGAGLANAIDFNTGTSVDVSITGNDFVTPTAKTLIAIQKEAGHTFTPTTNIFRDNKLNGLTNSFQVSVGSIEYATIEITNSEIKALTGSPGKQLIATPGGDRLIELLSATLVLNYGSEVLVEPSAPDDLAIEYNAGVGPQIATWDTTGFITSSADAVLVIQAGDINNGASAVISSTVVNRNIALVNTGGSYTGNASNDTTMTVHVAYRVHLLGL